MKYIELFYMKFVLVDNKTVVQRKRITIVIPL